MNRQILLWLPLMVFLILRNSAAVLSKESDISAKVEVDRAFATIGDRVNFRVTATHSPKITILELDARDALADFEVKEVNDFSTEEAGTISEGKNYVITNYTLGEYVIRPFSIRYRSGGGEVSELKTNSLYITIESIEKNKDPKSDIKGVKGIRTIKSRIWFWFFVIILLSALAAIIIWYLQKKQEAPAISSQVLLTPDEEAYQALNRLKNSDLIRKGQMKLYFFQMSEILRHYFERRYGIRALESTTFEVAQEIKEKTTRENAELILEVLTFCDLVKFAKYMPQPAELLRSNQQAKLIIDQTREIQEPVSLPPTGSSNL